MTLTYPADPATVAAMFADPEFTRRARFEGSGADAADVEAVDIRTERTGEAFTVTVEGPVPASVIPANLRSYVPGAVRMRGIDQWDAPAPDGSRHGTLEASLSGVPATISATQDLTAAPGDPASSVRTVRAVVAVKIPILGGAIERKAAEHVESVLRAEERASAAWLAGR